MHFFFVIISVHRIFVDVDNIVDIYLFDEVTLSDLERELYSLGESVILL